MEGWNYIHIDSREEMMMSGWKLYIYGDSVQQGVYLSNVLKELLVEYNLTAKVVTSYIVNRNKSRNIAWGAMVVYLNDPVILDVSGTLVGNIQHCLKRYDHSGRIQGARSIDGRIHYRYDLYEPVDALKGISYDKYYSLYRGEYGPYNILNNKDIL